MTAVLNETVATETAFTGRERAPERRAAGSAWAAAPRPTPARPARRAAHEALAGRSASLVMVFCPADIDMQAMLEGVRAEAGDVPLIGCSGLAQLAQSGPAEPAVVVSALGGDGFEVRTSVALNVSTGQRAAGEQVADVVDSLTSDHKFLMLLADGLAGDQHELVRGAYNVVGATVGLAGGCAADEYLYEQTFQFIGDANGVRVLSDAVVAAAIGSDAPIGVGVAHGWRKVGEPDGGDPQCRWARLRTRWRARTRRVRASGLVRRGRWPMTRRPSGCLR